ncbi:DUF4856 domain-containing protein [Brumimicrobium oceani]|uniref:DUF4856 domain-containing protein n=1 Tax=Brumimicrobium oceani TaxID=2100725 RepID=A0A2U2X543_9FLAO|nr:DUF4856 domain-containing protein [Brumimicrobium oceani]PWH82916.1 hypothetical protein DIT68_13550 [Brumimicrobium oceani]
MSLKIFSLLMTAFIVFTACKKEGCTDKSAINYNAEADKDDGSCVYNSAGTGGTLEIPDFYSFEDNKGNSTVQFQSQTDILQQLKEMVEVLESGTDGAILPNTIFNMYGNQDGNGGGNFSFYSDYGLAFQTSSDGEDQIRDWFYDLASASNYNGYTAANGQAGVLMSGSKKYLFDEKGYERVRLIEKGLMGAVFMYRALEVLLGEDYMNVNNSEAVDPENGEYYTKMEHHFDMAFGSFGVDTDFPTQVPDHSWGKYCNESDAALNSNAVMMDNFLMGRTAISNGELVERDAAISQIRLMWENIAAQQALHFLNSAKSTFNSDKAKTLHALSEAYGFCWILRYAPGETRRLTNFDYGTLIGSFTDNMWNMTTSNINDLISFIEWKYN